MKKIFYLIFLVAGFMSCKKEITGPELDPSEFVKPEFTETPTDGPYKLKERKGDEEFASIKWDAVDFGVPTANKYNLKVTVEGYEKSAIITSTEGNNTEVSVINKELNAALMRVLEPESAVDISEVKAIISVTGYIDEINPNPAHALVSDPADFLVTPYFQGPQGPPELSGNSLGVPGDHQDWKPANENTRVVEVIDGSGIYEGYVYLKSQWKIAEPDNSWPGPNYGYSQDWNDNSGTYTTVLSDDNDAGNLTPPAGAGMYYIKFELASKTIEVQKVTWSLVGSALDAPVELEYDLKSYNLFTKSEFKDGEFKIVGSHGVNLGDGGVPNLLIQDGAGLSTTAGTHEFYVNLTNMSSLFYRWGVPVPSVPSVITAPSAGSEFILESDKDAEIMAKFEWTPATYDEDLLPTEYRLQIGNEVIKGGIVDLFADVTVGDVNIAALNGGYNIGEVNDIPITVVAVINEDVSIISEPVIYKITPHENSWGLIGDASPGGWENSTALTYNSDTDTYSGVVDLVDGQLKFRKNNAWADQLGAKNGPDPLMGINELTRGGNEGTFQMKAGKYKFILDVNAETVAILPWGDNSWGIIGNATAGDWSDSSNLVLEDGSSDTYSGTFALTAGELKFRYNNSWDLNLGGDGLSGTGVVNGSNIQIPSDGIYDITLVYADENNASYEIVKQ